MSGLLAGLVAYLASFLTNATLYVLFVVGLNLQYGTTGLVNFGHVAFLAIGAYTAVLLGVHGVPILFATAAGVAVSAVFGVLLAFPALRLRDDYLAIVTIGFAEVLRTVVNNVQFTGGPQGIYGYAVPLRDLGLGYQAWQWLFLALVVALTALAFALTEYVVRSPYGRVLKAIREDQEVAVALGKNIVGYKVASFALGAGVAGLAGALLAYYYGAINPHNFEAIVTFEAWIIMVLGGTGRNWGAVLGALIYFGLYSATARYAMSGVGAIAADRLAALRIVAIGVLLVVLMIYRPQGILGRKEDLGLER
ncbi:MAG: branched-chain amino acid ABC transporter permease [Clostridia bacterium]|nr:branched-chain amino acid ABC transporter permease [Clostridia bacterium]